MMNRQLKYYKGFLGVNVYKNYFVMTVGHKGARGMDANFPAKMLLKN